MVQSAGTAGTAPMVEMSCSELVAFIQRSIAERTDYIGKDGIFHFRARCDHSVWRLRLENAKANRKMDLKLFGPKNVTLHSVGKIEEHFTALEAGGVPTPTLPALVAEPVAREDDELNDDAALSDDTHLMHPMDVFFKKKAGFRWLKEQACFDDQFAPTIKAFKEYGFYDEAFVEDDEGLRESLKDLSDGLIRNYRLEEGLKPMYQVKLRKALRGLGAARVSAEPPAPGTAEAAQEDKDQQEVPSEEVEEVETRREEMGEMEEVETRREEMEEMEEVETRREEMEEVETRREEMEEMEEVETRREEMEEVETRREEMEEVETRREEMEEVETRRREEMEEVETRREEGDGGDGGRGRDE